MSRKQPKTLQLVQEYQTRLQGNKNREAREAREVCEAKAEVEVDVAIVGGGIAGMLTAYRMLQKHSTWRVLVFEQSSKAGGRTKSGVFCKHKVAMGAGVGRSHKDKLLANLLAEVNMELVLMPPSSSGPDKQQQRLQKLVDFAKNLTEDNDISFKHFAQQILGTQEFEAFVNQMGFTDMLQASARQTMNYYGLDDNVKSWSAFVVQWDALVKKLADFVGKTTFAKLHSTCSSGLVTNTKVLDMSVCQETNSIVLQVATGSNTRFKNLVVSSKHVVLATSISGLKQLLPSKVVKCSKLHYVKSQPFARVYAKVASQDRALMQTAVQKYRVVSPSILMKVREISAQDGVYMLAYADNTSARRLFKTLSGAYQASKDPKATRVARLSLEAVVAKALNVVVKITSFKLFWFEEGTHFYRKGLPLEFEMQPFADLSGAWHGSPNVYVVGEAVAKMQGWTEGVIESVHAAVKALP